MIRNDHTFLSIYDTIHNFKSFKVRDKIHRIKGKYHLYKCTRCGITGRRYYDGKFICIHKQYGQKKFSKCNMEDNEENVIGKYIKIVGLIHYHRRVESSPRPKAEYKDKTLYVGSIHRILDDSNFNIPNNSRGVWVMGKKEPIRIVNFEFEFASKSKRTKHKKHKKAKHKKSKRMKW